MKRPCQRRAEQKHAAEARLACSHAHYALEPGGVTAVQGHDALVVVSCLMKRTRPQIESHVNFVHADVSSLNNQVLGKAG